jgi:hypothetical protein
LAGGEKVRRWLDARSLADWRLFKETPLFRSLTADGRLVRTEEVPAALPAPWAACLEHERIPFISYPYEWTFGMLRDAALFQLELVDRALDDGLSLRDATPYNVQWRGARPVFIDVPSFSRRTEGEPWTGYRQFCRLFLFPLLLEAHRGQPLQPLLRSRLEGPSAAETAALFSLRDAFRPGVLLDVLLQARFESRHEKEPVDARREIAAAGFRPEFIRRNVRRLRGVVESLRLPPAPSAWSGYTQERTYSPDDVARKKAFVKAAVHARPRRLAWDLGCNTGEFSKIAAENAALTVAMDADPAVVDALYRERRDANDRTILPLVMNVADPSPAQGWRGRERGSLEDRGRPDLVLALALVHHLSITAHVPLAEVADWFRSLGADLVVEFVGREDPMTRRLLQNKEDIYGDYSRENFERELAKGFAVKETLDLCGGTRRLYHAAPRA